MTLSILAGTFTTFDLAALSFAILSAIAIGQIIEHPPTKHPSVTSLMAQYRREWMVAFIDRDPRIFDAQILTSLRQSTAFFASSCLIAIGGLLALMGAPDRLLDLTKALTGVETVTSLKLQLKLALVALYLIYGFLKFVWGTRLFGYCAVIMGSVPNDVNDPRCAPRAAMAGEINIRAALNFNRGLRAVYFAIASLAWLAGPLVLILAMVVTLWVLWSREFSSHASMMLRNDVA